MSRADAFGFFWDDRPVPKVSTKPAKVKRPPPDPVWLAPTYLPGLHEAQGAVIPRMSREEILDHMVDKTPLVFDVECYPNSFMCNFKSTKTGNYILFETGNGVRMDTDGLMWCLTKLCCVGFNSISYDIVVATLAAYGASTMDLFNATNMLITEGMWPTQVYSKFGVRSIKGINHIDLIEVAPLMGSLKTYAGRIHVKKLQDLPFQPGTYLTPDQITCVRWYNVNSDLPATVKLFECLKPHIDLRAEMSNRFKVDLRSKSDAQIAEAVIKKEYKRHTGLTAKAPGINPGFKFYYKVPSYIRFRNPELAAMLEQVRATEFSIKENGKVAIPNDIFERYIAINGTEYKMGIGGLHSHEKSVSHYSTDSVKLVDKDVTSYYPYLIIGQRVIPLHLGEAFLQIYTSIVEDRVEAKRLKKKVVANSLKIVVNGAFGKLADPHSIMYSPENMIQVTLSGQLSLLMLVDWLEYAGFHVVSANTDGIVTMVDNERRSMFDQIVAEWEKQTMLETEETCYRSLHCRDVNNYIAVLEDGSTKNKGVYANPWGKTDDPATCLHKNPVTTVCIDAVCELLTNGTPIETTILECKDINKFIALRNCRPGAASLADEKVVYLGKTLRWYYGTQHKEPLIIVTSGNNVPESEGAVPCAQLPETIPENLDYDWYIERANKLLAWFSHSEGEEEQT